MLRSPSSLQTSMLFQQPSSKQLASKGTRFPEEETKLFYLPFGKKNLMVSRTKKNQGRGLGETDSRVQRKATLCKEQAPNAKIQFRI